MPTQSDVDSVAAYYQRKERERKEAWKRFEEAQLRGAPPDELRRLRRLAEDAGFTVD